MFYLDVLKVDLVLHVFFNSGVGHVTMAPVAGVITAFLALRTSPSPYFPPSYRGSSSSARKPYPISAQAPTEVVASGGLDGGAMPAWWPRSKLRFAPSPHVLE